MSDSLKHKMVLDKSDVYSTENFFNNLHFTTIFVLRSWSLITFVSNLGIRILVLPHDI